MTFFPPLLLLLFLPIFYPATATLSPPLIDRFIKTPTKNATSSKPQEYVDPTLPPSLLPADPPACSLLLLSHDFSNTYGSPPFSVPYSPPPRCPPPWSRVVLDLSVSSSGDQYDRIAAVWLAGAELLRTSTAEPTPSGVFWRVRKDVTRYRSLLLRPSNLSMMLENIVNDVFTGVYHVNLSLNFYPHVDDPQSNRRSLVSSIPMDGDPADLILPISNGNGSDGFWFRIQNKSDVHFKDFKIPRNAFKAVLELYVSFHSNDEFWYSNPPDSYIKKNNLTTGRGNGAFRQVYVTIDRHFVGSVVPFPVIFTGGINPLFWSPVVAIGAFDLPSYNLDLTPFLGLLLDGRHHKFGFSVTDGISFWLVDANLHLWLDSDSSSVQAKLTNYEAPALTIARDSKFLYLNGSFKIDAEKKAHFSGWVNSSLGNFTTEVNHKIKFKSLIVYQKNGNYKEVHMKAKVKMGVTKKKGQELILSRYTHKYKYPLSIVTSTLDEKKDTSKSMTNLSHTFHEESLSFIGDNKLVSSHIVIDKQDAGGWMLVQDHSVLSGSAETRQEYQYKGNGQCYTRTVSAQDGELLSDSTSIVCPPPP